MALNKDRIDRETFLIPLSPGVRLLLYLAFCLHATIFLLCEVSEPLTSNHNAIYSFGFHMTLKTKNRINKEGQFHSWRAFSSSCLYSFIFTTNGSNIVWMLFTSDQLILPAFDHSQHSQTQRAPLLRQQLLWNLFVRDRIFLRQPMRLIVPSYLGIIHAIILWKSHILHPPPILKDIKQQTMWIIGCGLFVSHYKPREWMAFCLHLPQAYCPSFLLFPSSKVEKTYFVLGC